MTDIRGFPMLLADLARQTNPSTALALVAAKGGQRVYIPRTIPAKDHWLIQVLGCEGASAMISLRGGEMVEIPTARATKSTKVSILESIEKGHSSNQIAADHRVTHRYVKRLRQEYAQPAPLPLFDN